MNPFTQAAGRMMWLGTHELAWVTDPTMPPLFVSRPRLAGRKVWPAPVVPVAVDSGGYSELTGPGQGRWRCTVVEYADFVAAAVDWGARWVGPMDWVCSPKALAASALTVQAHQCLTVDGFVQLRAVLGPLGGHVTPVLQGWTVEDYVRCLGLYERAGVDLDDEPLVGVGSIARGPAAGLEVADILVELAATGLRLHAFGAGRSALELAFRRGALDWTPTGDGTPQGDTWTPTGVVSWDSLGWSRTAVLDRVHLDGCDHRGLCANCPRWAARWRDSYLATVTEAHRRHLTDAQVEQLTLFA